MISNILIGLGFAVFIAFAAWRARSLTYGGAVAAAVLGAVVFGLGGLGWAILLLAFFTSSSALSRLFRKQKRMLEDKFSKGSRRDAAQVAANGGVAGIFVFLHAIFPDAYPWTWAAFAGALAAANADTWATELGVLSRSAPRLITSGRVVERGESGGISVLGSLAALSGSALIAFLAVLLWQGRVVSLSNASPFWLVSLVSPQTQALSLGKNWAWFGIITLAGFAGSLADSFLGATFQAIYHCPACQKETERHPLHTCGALTRRVRGLPWLNNDWVNAACTLAGSLAALLGVLL